MSFKKRILFLGSAMLFSAFAAPALATCIPQGAWSAGSFRDGIPLCAADLNNNNAYLSSLFSPATLLGNPNTWTARQTFTGVTLSNITGLTQCLDVNSSGIVSGAGSNCLLGSNNLGDVADARIALANLSGLPRAPNNSFLASVSYTAYPAGILRTGFAAAGDAPPLLYVGVSGSCSVADGGSCVNGSSGSWLAIFPSTGYDGRWWGAVCNPSTTNDTMSFGAAENYIEAIGGGTLIVPGQCKFKLIVAGNNVTVKGVGLTGAASGGSAIVAPSLTGAGAAVSVGTVSAFKIQDLGVTSTAQQTSGSLIKFTGTNFSSMDDVFVTHGYDNIVMSDVNLINVSGGGSRDFENRAFYATGIGPGSTAINFANFASDEDPLGCLVSGTPTNCTPIAGFNGDLGGAWQFGNGTFFAHGHKDYLINPVSGQIVDWPEWQTGSVADTCDMAVAGNIYQGGVGIDIAPTGGGIVNLDKVQAWVGSCTRGEAFEPDNSSVVSGGSVTGKVVASGQTGIYIKNAVHMQLAGGLVVAGSGQATSFTSIAYPQIEVDGAASVDFGQIIAGASDTYTNSADYGLQVDASFTGSINALGLDARGNNVAAWLNSASNAGITINFSPGINPVGVASISVSASPFTYTAGVSPEIVVIESGTITSAAYASGGTLCTTTPCDVYLGAHQSVQVAYPGAAPVMITNRQ